MNEEEISKLTADDYERRLERSYGILANAGAHYVVDTVNDLPPVIEDINRRLAAGETPDNISGASVIISGVRDFPYQVSWYESLGGTLTNSETITANGGSIEIPIFTINWVSSFH